jgi:tRNA A37 threonylcarbamoyladenosine synthetase subunit TsaC/SUA5/YrdC
MYSSAKKTVEEQGGKITHTFSLIKGFTVEFPTDTVYTLKSNDQITVEADGKVTTQ